jgi:hypothetical protein
MRSRSSSLSVLLCAPLLGVEYTVKHFPVKKHARTTHVVVKVWQNEAC